MIKSVAEEAEQGQEPKLRNSVRVRGQDKGTSMARKKKNQTNSEV